MGYYSKKGSKHTGRPSSYTKEIGQEILDRIATEDISIKAIVDSDPRFPEQSTFFRWINHIPEFRSSYFLAKQNQATIIEDSIRFLTDNPLEYKQIQTEIDQQSGKLIETVKIIDNIQRARLMIETRKWQMARLAPEKFGDKVEIGSDPDRPLTVVIKKFGE